MFFTDTEVNTSHFSIYYTNYTDYKQYDIVRAKIFKQIIKTVQLNWHDRRLLWGFDEELISHSIKRLNTVYHRYHTVIGKVQYHTHFVCSEDFPRSKTSQNFFKET